MYGQEPKLPGDFLPPFLSLTDPAQEQSTAIQGRIPEVRRLLEARQLAEDRLKTNAAKDKARWDAALKPQIFFTGDHVLMRHENKFSLEYNWKGPFRVLAVNHDTHIYKLQDLNGKPYSSWVHTDRLRPIHLPSATPPQEPWYDPTAARAAERRYFEAAHQLSLLSEDVQHSKEGILS